MNEMNNLASKKNFSLTNKTIDVFSCIQKQDKFYPYLILAISCILTSGIFEAFNSSLGLYLLGYYNLMLNNNTNAINSFSQLIKSGENFDYLYALRGMAYADLGQYDLANQDYSKDLQVHPCHNMVRIEQARLFLQKHDYATALKICDYIADGCYLNCQQNTQLQLIRTKALAQLNKVNGLK